MNYINCLDFYCQNKELTILGWFFVLLVVIQTILFFVYFLYEVKNEKRFNFCEENN